MKIPPPNDTDAPQYGQRDTLEQGNYFMRHMLAMTGESLHAKSAIAAELAHRDMEIDRLRKDAELLAWVLAHPETAAECLEDAAAGDGTARENLERRIAGLTQANAGGRLGAA